MNFKMIGRINAFFLLVEAAFMLPALIICLFDRDGKTAVAFAVTVLLLALTAVLLLLLTRHARRGFYVKEGLVCTGLGWILISFFGCFPFFFSGQIPSFMDALFETVSGFTTTGASILSNVEALTNGAMYWRCFTHWLGGMGVLVFLLAIAPLGGDSDGFTMHLLRAESPGPNVGKLVPKMRKTAVILYLIYVALTVLDFIFLVCGGLSVFDAVCTAFGTAGTGGFGIRNDSMISFSPYLQNVTTVFMLLFGVNFTCYYFILIGQVKNVFRDEELRLYAGIVIGSALLIALNTRGMFSSVWDTLRHSFFQVASIISTSGFATYDFDLWPTFSKAILFCLMFLGASAGSTGGGLKCARLLILLKAIRRNIKQVVHPKMVRVVRVNGQAMDDRIISNTTAYFAVYILIMVISLVIVSLDGFAFGDSVSAVVSCFNNIGPGFGAFGATMNYGGASVLSKITLIFDMLLGRLEIFPILILFSANTWKKY